MPTKTSVPMPLMTVPTSFMNAAAFTPAWLTAMAQVNTKLWTIATASQQVIWLRLSMLATGGPTAANQREATRMVSEKVSATQESVGELAKLAASMLTTLPTVWSDPRAGEKMLKRAATGTNRALAPYSRRVSANAERLSK
jgi:hypothetical protein